MRKLVVLLTVSIVLVAGAGVAGAVWDPDLVGGPPAGPSQLVMDGVGPGHGVNGFLGPVGSVSDPSVPYPTTNPGPPFTPRNEGFAGIVWGDPGDGGADVPLYCINIRTSTFGGVGYDLGTWDAANVNNVGYVAQLLNNYYPTVPVQPPLGSESDRAAAVQAAIWYFSDNFVTSTSDPLHDTVAGIVDHVIALGPLVQPPPPNLEIDPATDSGPIGAVVGPYTIVSPQEPAVVSSPDGTMFGDAAGTVPIANGTSVADGTQLWLRRDSLGSATLNAEATAVVPGGNVYLYSHNIPDVPDAQKLILAESSEVTSTASATADFFDTAALIVTKTVDGSAAGRQSDVRISVTCGDRVMDDFVVPAGTTGSQVGAYNNVPTPTTCTVTETVDGVNAAVTVSTVNVTQSVDMPQTDELNERVRAAPITNTYTAMNIGPDVVVVPVPVQLQPRFTG